MAKKYAELRKKMSPEARARAEQMTLQMLAELPLHKLRQARGMTQTQLAEQIGSSQPEVSQMERRANIYVSTLRRFVEALGGELEIVARFPEGMTRVSFESDEGAEDAKERAHG